MSTALLSLQMVQLATRRQITTHKRLQKAPRATRRHLNSSLCQTSTGNRPHNCQFSLSPQACIRVLK